MSGRIPHNFIDDLISRTDIIEVINSRLPLKRKGKEYTACCPFHNEKTPSFTVSETKQFYHCFGCGAHGNVIGFLMEFDHLEYVDAIETLAADQHLDVPREGSGEKKNQPNNAPIYAVLQHASQLYQQQLNTSTRAINYLKQRGLGDDIIKQYKIGYAPDNWNFLHNALTDKTFTTEQLFQAGLLIQNDKQKPYDRFRDRIMFSITDQRGRIIGFGGRILDKGEPKYLNSPEIPVFHKGTELYGLYEVKQTLRKIERLLIVEGYMDVIALSQHNINYAVASLGTATTTEQIQKMFRTTHEVIFCYDGDNAGKKAAWHALENTLPVIRDGMVAKFLFLPENEDPDTMVRKEGKAAFEQRIQTATPLSDYLFNALSVQIESDTVEGRAKLAKQVSPLITNMHNGVFKDLLLEQLSQRVGLNSSQLEAKISQQQKTITAIKPKPIARQQVKNNKTRVAIALLLQNPAFVSSCEIPPDFNTAITKGLSLLYHLHQTIKTNPGITSAALLERYRGHKHELSLNSLAIWTSLETENPKTREQDYIDIISRLELEDRYEFLSHKEKKEGLSEKEICEFLALSTK